MRAFLSTRLIRSASIIIFYFLLSNNSGKTQTTSYTPLFTSANFVKTIDLSRPVGVIEGAAEVTPIGGSTYSIPIYAPPGTNRLAPSIALVYSSQAGNGIAGYGWGITGLSIISRTGKNIYHNGITAPVSYTSDDAFWLDGIRLNVISGLNGANGTVYAGEAESFAQITSFTSGSVNNPDWFKVTAKDGSVMEFGHSTDSRILTDDGQNVMFWRLTKIVDVHGNYIEFRYNNTNRDSRIEKILYTGNANTGLLPYNELNFSYTLRTDANTNYERGATLSSKYLLNKIAVIHSPDAGGTQTIKTYKCNYGFDNVHSMLKEIIEYGGDEAAPALNSTIFLYGDPPQNFASLQTIALQGPYGYHAGDFDADGKTDLLAAESYFDQDIGTRLHTQFL